MIDYLQLHWSDFFGNAGVVLLVAHLLVVQADKIDAKGFWYSFNNFMVALLFINLYYKSVLANIILEVFWCFISLYGLYNWKKRQKS